MSDIDMNNGCFLDALIAAAKRGRARIAASKMDGTVGLIANGLRAPANSPVGEAGTHGERAQLADCSYYNMMSVNPQYSVRPSFRAPEPAVEKKDPGATKAQAADATTDKDEEAAADEGKGKETDAPATT